MEHYRRRFLTVLHYIDAHLDEPLNGDLLSEVAAFSKFHFHRLFSAWFGMSLTDYVCACRMKRASYRLAFRHEQTLTRIALDSGYQSPEAFGRAFKKHQGQTPSRFRATPDWNTWSVNRQQLQEIRKHMIMNHESCRDIRIVDIPKTRLLVLEHHGDPKKLGDSIRAFIQFRKSHHLSPERNATYNIVYGDPEQVEPEKYRIDLGVATDLPLPTVDEENGPHIHERFLPAGRCACLRHVGSDETLRNSVMYLYQRWLPESGDEPADFPLFFQRIRFFPDVPEHEAVTDVFLPLKTADTSVE